jgi:nucleoside-diphosphate-sugar epimerase
MTNIEDLAEFVERFLDSEQIWGGIFNVVNPQPISTSVMIDALKQHGVCNSNWKYIELDELLEKHTTTGRSNCVLDSTKLEKLNLSLPDTLTSLNRCVKIIKDEFTDKDI